MGRGIFGRLRQYLRSRYLLNGSGETLYVRHEILKDSELFATAATATRPVTILQSDAALPCPHLYYGSIDMSGQRSTDSGRPFTMISTGFCMGRSDSRDRGPISYQQGDNNELGHWLAYQVTTDDSAVFILQRETCLNCIMGRMIEWRGLSDYGKGNKQGFLTRGCDVRGICIIAGRLDQ